MTAKEKDLGFATDMVAVTKTRKCARRKAAQRLLAYVVFVPSMVQMESVSLKIAPLIHVKGSSIATRTVVERS